MDLHPRLAADTFKVGDLPLSSVLLMNDSRYPWVILVPWRDGLREVHTLSPIDQIQLMGEITLLSQGMQDAFAAQKTNIGALGNMVPQLHIHIIMRNEGDAAWPGPVWGAGTAVPYSDKDRTAMVAKINAVLLSA